MIALEWSMMLQKLEQDLCESLRDRVHYGFIKVDFSLIQFCMYVDHQI
jgi:hypothetical protein